MIKPKVSFRLKQDLLDDVDQLIKDGKYKDRTDFFNTATVQEIGRANFEGYRGGKTK